MHELGNVRWDQGSGRRQGEQQERPSFCDLQPAGRWDARPGELAAASPRRAAGGGTSAPTVPLTVAILFLSAITRNENSDCAAGPVKCSARELGLLPAQGPGVLRMEVTQRGGKGDGLWTAASCPRTQALSVSVKVLRAACLPSPPPPPRSVLFSLVSVCTDFGPNHLLEPTAEGRRGGLALPGTRRTPSAQLPLATYSSLMAEIFLCTKEVLNTYS